MVDKKSEPLEVKIFKRSIKFDLLQAVDGVINSLAHPAALGELSSKERDEFTNFVLKNVEELLQEVIVETKERARLVIQSYQEEEKLVEKLKKRNGQQLN